MPGKRSTTLSANNTQIMNAIRNEASLQYQSRIPEATQANMTETLQRLNNFRPQMNEFVDALVNRIALVQFQSKTWKNKFAFTKRGFLGYGDTIEDVFVGLLKAKDYNPSDNYEDVFKQNRPEIYSNFHRINRANMYEVSINDSMLQRAFTDNSGLQMLTDHILTRPYTSDEFDEYLIQRELFKTYESEGKGFAKIHVPDLAKAQGRTARADAAAEITEKVRATASQLSFIKAFYNKAGVQTWTEKTDLVLYGTPEFIAACDVNIIAFAFNASAADLFVRVVEVDDFQIEGCQAILADKDFLFSYDTYINFESIRNPKSRAWNYFLHHDGIYSVSNFCNAVMFTSKEVETPGVEPLPDPTSITVALGESSDGKAVEFAHRADIVEMLATVEPAGANQSVIWSVTGEKPLDVQTTIDKNGILHVADDEPNDALTVYAVATRKPSVVGSLKVGVDKAAG